MENLDKFIGEMVKLLQDAKAFASSEIPKFFEEILKYHAARAIVYIVIGFMIYAMFAYLARFFAKCYAKEVAVHDAIVAANEKEPSHHSYSRVEKPDEALENLAILVRLAGWIVSAWIVLYWAIELLQIALAPRMFLLEYFQSLVGRCR